MRRVMGGQVIEPGMSVDVSTVSLANPLFVNGGQAVADAFSRIYGVDLKKINACNSAYLKSEKIG